MNAFRPYIIGGVVGLVVGFLIGSPIDCGPRIGGFGMATPYPVQIELDPDTVIRYETVMRDRWRIKEVPTAVEIDTTREPVLSPAYLARLDTIMRGDTLGVAFRHPERTIDIDYRPRPDSIAVMEIRVDNIIGLPDNRRWGIGFHIGPGIQMGRDGVIRAGVEVGIGVNFNLLEP